jgi:hypothetical protein
MALKYIPSDSRTACAACKHPIVDTDYHTMAIHASDNTAAEIYNLSVGDPAKGFTKLRFVCGSR